MSPCVACVATGDGVAASVVGALVATGDTVAADGGMAVDVAAPCDGAPQPVSANTPRHIDATIINRLQNILNITWQNLSEKYDKLRI